jgi:hypothetical protein
MPPVQIYIVGRVLKRQGGYIAWEVLFLTTDQPTAVLKCTQVNDFYAAVMTETILQIDDPPIAGGIFPNA